MALPLALAVILVLTIAVAAVIDFGASGSRNAALQEARQEAKAIAEGAFNSGAAIIGAAADPATATLPDCTTWSAWTTVAAGEAMRWCGAYDAATETWTVKGQGRVANPTGPAAVQTRTVQGMFELVEDNGAWNFVWLRSAPGDCISIKNSFGFTAPLYVVGCLELENSAVYNGPHLYVTDYVWTTHPTAGVGSAADPVPNVSVRDTGCRYRSSPTYHMPCTSAQNIWTDVFDREVPDIPKPPAYFQEAYDAAQPGDPSRGHTCTSVDITRFNSKFTATRMDDNNAMDKSVGTIDLMPSPAYDCSQRAADGSVLGRIQWSGVTIDPADGMKKGTLTITGTIVLDGDLVTQNDIHGVVNGTGIIYVTNTLTMQSNSWLCGTVDCGLSWDPNMDPPHLVFVYAGIHDPAANSIIVQSDAKFQGGLYAAGRLKVENNGFVHGPAVAEQTISENGADFNPWPWFIELPEGVESGMGLKLRLKRGTWHS